jgi:hypothetical protein
MYTTDQAPYLNLAMAWRALMQAAPPALGDAWALETACPWLPFPAPPGWH